MSLYTRRGRYGSIFSCSDSIEGWDCVFLSLLSLNFLNALLFFFQEKTGGAKQVLEGVASGEGAHKF